MYLKHSEAGGSLTIDLEGSREEMVASVSRVYFRQM